MNLNAVTMFVTAVQAGGLSAAATRLEMALPTLSRHIRELEGALKVRLFAEQAVSLLYPSRRLVSSIVRAYIEFCQANVTVFCDEQVGEPPPVQPLRVAARKR